MYFSLPSKDSIRKYAFQIAPEIALNATILAGLIIIRPILGRLAGRAEYFHPLGPESRGRNYLSLQAMSTCAAVVGFFAYTSLFLGISISLEDEREQVQAILRTIIKGSFSLATEAVRACIGRLFRMAAYPVGTVWVALDQTLRARLGTMPRYIGFPACLGVITRPFFSKLKLVTFCLFFFCLGVVVTMAYYHSQSLSTYAHFASSELCLATSDLTHLAEALFATITVTNLNSVLTAVLSYLGLRFLVRSLLSSIASISYHNKKARSLRPKAFLLINKDDKQDNPTLEDENLVEFDEYTLCNVRY